jgi:hypothetical protein
MKLQILDKGLESNREGKNIFHFLTSLTQEYELCLRHAVLFFSELDTVEELWS